VAKMQWRGISFISCAICGSILGCACLEHGPDPPIPFLTRGWAMLVAVERPELLLPWRNGGPLCFGIVGTSSLHARGPDANCGRENPMYLLVGGAWSRTRIHRILIGLMPAFFIRRAGSEEPYMRKGFAGAGPRAFFVGCQSCFIPSILPHDLPHGGCGQCAGLTDNWGTFEGSAMSPATLGQGCLDWI
jgi:hypothetical protein